MDQPKTLRAPEKISSFTSFFTFTDPIFLKKFHKSFNATVKLTVETPIELPATLSSAKSSILRV